MKCQQLLRLTLPFLRGQSSLSAILRLPSRRKRMFEFDTKIDKNCLTKTLYRL
jgi:hypothetical protein